MFNQYIKNVTLPPDLQQYRILNDKRHILTKDTDNRVSLYDVLKAQRVEDLGIRDFDEEVKRRSQVTSKYYVYLINRIVVNFKLDKERSSIRIITKTISKRLIFD